MDVYEKMRELVEDEKAIAEISRRVMSISNGDVHPSQVVVSDDGDVMWKTTLRNGSSYVPSAKKVIESQEDYEETLLQREKILNAIRTLMGQYKWHMEQMEELIKELTPFVAEMRFRIDGEVYFIDDRGFTKHDYD